MQYGFVKTAALTPSIRVADCAYNARQIIEVLRGAAAEQQHPRRGIYAGGAGRAPVLTGGEEEKSYDAICAASRGHGGGAGAFR